MSLMPPASAAPIEPATDHATTAGVSPAASSASPTAGERLSYLFRDSIRTGRLHPLYLPLLRYRNVRAER